MYIAIRNLSGLSVFNIPTILASQPPLQRHLGPVFLSIRNISGLDILPYLQPTGLAAQPLDRRKANHSACDRYFDCRTSLAKSCKSAPISAQDKMGAGLE